VDRDQSFASLGFSDGGKMSEFGFSHLGSVERMSRTNNVTDRCHGQEIGEDAESILTGRVLNDNFLTVGIDVRIMTDLIAGSITEVGSGLIGSNVTERSLTQLILRMVFAENGRWNSSDRCSMNDWKWCGQSVNYRQWCWKMMNDRSYMTDDRSYWNLMTEDGCWWFDDNFNGWCRIGLAIIASMARNGQTNEQKHDLMGQSVPAPYQK
jgi:hypothetical protein